MGTALLIIDVQQILRAGENMAHEVHGVIQRINLVSQQARNAGALVVVIQHQTKDGDMECGSHGWHLALAIELRGSDLAH